MDGPTELELELDVARRELKALAPDAFNERITLRDRIIELDAAVAADSPVHEDSLRMELADLRARHLEMMRTRIDPSLAHGGVGLAGGIDANFLHKANRKIDTLTGIKDVQARIREIERLLDAHRRDA